MDKKIGIIYKFTNKINGKLYVGQTIQNIDDRVRHHRCSKDGMVFHKAMRKYGRDNFIIEEICSTIDLKDLDSLERFFIKQLNSRVPNGYNVSLGGNGSPMQDRRHSEETKKKISISALGKPKSQEAKDRMSKAKIGRKQSPEHRANSAKARSGHFKKGHPIICDQTGEIFLNACEAASKTGLSRTKIYRQLTGQVKNTKCPLTFNYVEKRT